MKVLGLDTTRKSTNIYIKDNENYYVETIGDKIKHSEGLFLYLEKFLMDKHFKIDDFDMFCGGVGPGSFTGIRVGMSVIKAFAKAKDKKIIPINSFEVVKKHIKNGVFLLNSTALNCYYAEIKNSHVLNSGTIEKDKVLETFKEQKIYFLQEEQNDFGFEYNNIEIISNISDLFFAELENKISNPSDENFEPYYLQLSQAEKNANE